MSYLRTFARFWWNFIVGDDWRAAVLEHELSLP